MIESTPCIKCGAVERYTSGRCAPCNRAADTARYAADPERYRARSAAWRAANPEKARASEAAWRAANPEKARTSTATYHATPAYRAKAAAAAGARRYGFPDGSAYRAFLNRSCQICGTPATHVDHKHTTRTVRGALCANHNRGLGQFRDNIAHLYAAIEYLAEAH